MPLGHGRPEAERGEKKDLTHTLYSPHPQSHGQVVEILDSAKRLSIQLASFPRLVSALLTSDARMSESNSAVGGSFVPVEGMRN